MTWYSDQEKTKPQQSQSCIFEEVVWQFLTTKYWIVWHQVNCSTRFTQEKIRYLHHCDSSSPGGEGQLYTTKRQRI